MDYDIHFGKVEEGKIVDWRKELENEPDVDDDEELDVTPPDVIAMLGFDPKEFSDKPKSEKEAV